MAGTASLIEIAQSAKLGGAPKKRRFRPATKLAGPERDD
jgi:hypothetical protein